MITHLPQLNAMHCTSISLPLQYRNAVAGAETDILPLQLLTATQLQRAMNAALGVHSCASGILDLTLNGHFSQTCNIIFCLNIVVMIYNCLILISLKIRSITYWWFETQRKPVLFSDCCILYIISFNKHVSLMCLYF